MLKKVIMLAAVVMIAGCTSTITHYDAEGKVTKVEKVTNASRIMDGTNQKSQLILVDGTYIKSDISATAGESYTPGWVIKFVSGKTAVANVKDNGKLDTIEGSIEKFFQTYTITKDGVTTQKAATPATANDAVAVNTTDGVSATSASTGGGGSAAKGSDAAK